MDATQLRELVDGALAAQRDLEVADATLEAARKAREAARDRHVKESGNLRVVLNRGFVIYGDQVIRVGDNADGVCVVSSPLVSVPVLAPPPPPLPEADPPANIAATALNKSAAPLSGGSVPAGVKRK